MTVPFHVAPSGHLFNARSRRRHRNCGVYQRRRRGRCARTRTLRNAEQLQSNLHSRRYLLARAIHPGSATKNPVSDAQPSAGVPSLRYTARWHIPMVDGMTANTDMNWRVLTCVPVFVVIRALRRRSVEIPDRIRGADRVPSRVRRVVSRAGREPARRIRELRPESLVELARDGAVGVLSIP